MGMLIEVSNWKKKTNEEGEPTGFLEYVGQKKLLDVEEQLKAVLKEIHIERWGGNALECCEWIITNSDFNTHADFPKGEPLVVFRQGNNEGYRLQVIVHNHETRQMLPVFTVKYLSNEDSVWSVVKAVSRAFRDGQ